MIYVLLYPVFDAAAAARITAFRERHEPERARLVPPHITLVFGVDNTDLPAVSELVETVSRQTRPFEVWFERHTVAFDPFENKHKIFLICGEGSALITSLHTQLYDGPHRAQFNPAHPFDPHMTIGTFPEKTDADQADASAVGPFPMTGTVSAFELVRLEGGALTKLKTAPFGA